MDKQQVFEQLAETYGLKPADYYFLDWIPLIEMVWADGRNQKAELDLLYKFAIEQIAYLDQQAGAQLISIDDANDFLERFAHHRPPAALLHALHQLLSDANNPRRRSILEYCMDIAAACAPKYPYGLGERITVKEKQLLERLLREFDVPPDRQV